MKENKKALKLLQMFGYDIRKKKKFDFDDTSLSIYLEAIASRNYLAIISNSRSPFDKSELGGSNIISIMGAYDSRTTPIFIFDRGLKDFSTSLEIHLMNLIEEKNRLTLRYSVNGDIRVNSYRPKVTIIAVNPIIRTEFEQISPAKNDP